MNGQDYPHGSKGGDPIQGLRHYENIGNAVTWFIVSFASGSVSAPRLWSILPTILSWTVSTSELCSGRVQYYIGNVLVLCSLCIYGKLIGYEIFSLTVNLSSYESLQF